MGVRAIIDVLDIVALATGYGVLFFTAVALAAVATMVVRDAVLARRRVARAISGVLFESHRYDDWARTHARSPRRRGA